MKNFLNKAKKIFIVSSDKLKTKWWHRFFQVLIIGSAVFLFVFLFIKNESPNNPSFNNYIYNFEKGFGDIKGEVSTCYRKDGMWRTYTGDWCGNLGYNDSNVSSDSSFLNKYFSAIGKTDLLESARKRDYFGGGSQFYIDYQIASLLFAKNRNLPDEFQEQFNSHGLVTIDNLINEKGDKKWLFEVINDSVPYTMTFSNNPMNIGIILPIKYQNNWEKTEMDISQVPPYLETAVNAFNEQSISFKIISHNYFSIIYAYTLIILTNLLIALLWFFILESIIYRIIVYIVYGKQK